MTIQIDKMTLIDLENIKDILIADFDDFWTYNVLKDELNCNNSYYIVAKTLDNEIVGFAGIKSVLDESDILNIVVKKSFRNQGIGSLLLKDLINVAISLKSTCITLEVMEENLSAIYLYEKFGFEKIGIRKNYYKDKNGIIMCKKLT